MRNMHIIAVILFAVPAVARAQYETFKGVYKSSEAKMTIEFKDDGTGKTTWERPGGSKETIKFTYKKFYYPLHNYAYKIEYDGYGDQGYVVGSDRISKECYITRFKDGKAPEGDWDKFTKKPD
jgi:hypothetical protein